MIIQLPSRDNKQPRRDESEDDGDGSTFSSKHLFTIFTSFCCSKSVVQTIINEFSNISISRDFRSIAAAAQRPNTPRK